MFAPAQQDLLRSVDAFPDVCDEDIFQLALIVVGDGVRVIVDYEFIHAVLLAVSRIQLLKRVLATPFRRAHV